MENAGLYVHIPFCRAKCAYCNFNSGPDLTLKTQYLNCLAKEAELSGRLYAGAFDTVYFGGGTPSLLAPDEFETLAVRLRKSLRISPSAEWTVECNPESVTEDKLACYRACGVTRISLGVQSLSDACLRAVGRLHSAAEARRAVRLVAKRFENFGADFILGLPEERPEDVEDVLAFVKEYGVPHVSAYGLSVEPGTALQLRVQAGACIVPDADAAADRYEALSNGLEALGIARYEISNFARPGYECRHNEKYWSLAPYLGLGVSAHSYLNGERFANGDSVAGYIGALAAGNRFEKERSRITPEESEKEYLMLRLRTSAGVSRADYRNRFGAEITERYAEVFRRYPEFFETTEERVRVSAKGIYVVNSLLIEFD